MKTRDILIELLAMRFNEEAGDGSVGWFSLDPADRDSWRRAIDGTETAEELIAA